MTNEEQIKALVELDGITIREVDCPLCGHGATHPSWFDKDGSVICVKDYLNSYDAILPLIQKQDGVVQTAIHQMFRKLFLHKLFFWEYTPAKICEIVLRATDEWKD